MHEKTLRLFWLSLHRQSLLQGVASGRFSLLEDDVQLFTAQSAGAMLGVMMLVTDGRETSRKAGETFATIQLTALGLRATEVKRLVALELPSVDQAWVEQFGARKA